MALSTAIAQQYFRQSAQQQVLYAYWLDAGDVERARLAMDVANWYYQQLGIPYYLPTDLTGYVPKPTTPDAATALATAAAAIAVIIVRPNRGDEDIAVKGEPITLTIHRAGGPGSQPLATGDVVLPGDRIRFEVHAARRGYVAIVGVDGSGATTVYVPFASSDPVDFDPATGAVLPGAIKLDATPGDEHFYAVYASERFSIDSVAAALREHRALPAGVVAAEVVLHKATK